MTPFPNWEMATSSIPPKPNGEFDPYFIYSLTHRGRTLLCKRWGKHSSLSSLSSSSSSFSFSSVEKVKFITCYFPLPHQDDSLIPLPLNTLSLSPSYSSLSREEVLSTKYSILQLLLLTSFSELQSGGEYFLGRQVSFPVNEFPHLNNSEEDIDEMMNQLNRWSHSLTRPVTGVVVGEEEDEDDDSSKASTISSITSPSLSPTSLSSSIKPNSNQFPSQSPFPNYSFPILRKINQTIKSVHENIHHNTHNPQKNNQIQKEEIHDEEEKNNQLKESKNGLTTEKDEDETEDEDDEEDEGFGEDTIRDLMLLSRQFSSRSSHSSNNSNRTPLSSPSPAPSSSSFEPRTILATATTSKQDLHSSNTEEGRVEDGIYYSEFVEELLRLSHFSEELIEELKTTQLIHFISLYDLQKQYKIQQKILSSLPTEKSHPMAFQLNKTEHSSASSSSSSSFTVSQLLPRNLTFEIFENETRPIPTHSWSPIELNVFTGLIQSRYCTSDGRFSLHSLLDLKPLHGYKWETEFDFQREGNEFDPLQQQPKVQKKKKKSKKRKNVGGWQIVRGIEKSNDQIFRGKVGQPSNPTSQLQRPEAVHWSGYLSKNQYLRAHFQKEQQNQLQLKSFGLTSTGGGGAIASVGGSGGMTDDCGYQYAKHWHCLIDGIFQKTFIKDTIFMRYRRRLLRRTMILDRESHSIFTPYRLILKIHSASLTGIVNLSYVEITTGTNNTYLDSTATGAPMWNKVFYFPLMDIHPIRCSVYSEVLFDKRVSIFKGYIELSKSMIMNSLQPTFSLIPISSSSSSLPMDRIDREREIPLLPHKIGSLIVSFELRENRLFHIIQRNTISFLPTSSSSSSLLSTQSTISDSQLIENDRNTQLNSTPLVYFQSLSESQRTNVSESIICYQDKLSRLKSILSAYFSNHLSHFDDNSQISNFSSSPSSFNVQSSPPFSLLWMSIQELQGSLSLLSHTQIHRIYLSIEEILYHVQDTKKLISFSSSSSESRSSFSARFPNLISSSLAKDSPLQTTESSFKDIPFIQPSFFTFDHHSPSFTELIPWNFAKFIPSFFQHILHGSHSLHNNGSSISPTSDEHVVSELFCRTLIQRSLIQSNFIKSHLEKIQVLSQSTHSDHSMTKLNSPFDCFHRLSQFEMNRNLSNLWIDKQCTSSTASFATPSLFQFSPFLIASPPSFLPAINDSSPTLCFPLVLHSIDEVSYVIFLKNFKQFTELLCMLNRINRVHSTDLIHLPSVEELKEKEEFSTPPSSTSPPSSHLRDFLLSKQSKESEIHFEFEGEIAIIAHSNDILTYPATKPIMKNNTPSSSSKKTSLSATEFPSLLELKTHYLSQPQRSPHSIVSPSSSTSSYSVFNSSKIPPHPQQPSSSSSHFYPFHCILSTFPSINASDSNRDEEENESSLGSLAFHLLTPPNTQSSSSATSHTSSSSTSSNTNLINFLPILDQDFHLPLQQIFTLEIEPLLPTPLTKYLQIDLEIANPPSNPSSSSTFSDPSTSSSSSSVQLAPQLNDAFSFNLSYLNHSSSITWTQPNQTYSENQTETTISRSIFIPLTDDDLNHSFSSFSSSFDPPLKLSLHHHHHHNQTQHSSSSTSEELNLMNYSVLSFPFSTLSSHLHSQSLISSPPTDPPSYLTVIENPSSFPNRASSSRSSTTPTSPIQSPPTTHIPSASTSAFHFPPSLSNAIDHQLLHHNIYPTPSSSISSSSSFSFQQSDSFSISFESIDISIHSLSQFLLLNFDRMTSNPYFMISLLDSNGSPLLHSLPIQGPTNTNHSLPTSTINNSKNANTNLFQSFFSMNSTPTKTNSTPPTTSPSSTVSSSQQIQGHQQHAHLFRSRTKFNRNSCSWKTNKTCQIFPSHRLSECKYLLIEFYHESSSLSSSTPTSTNSSHTSTSNKNGTNGFSDSALGEICLSMDELYSLVQSTRKNQSNRSTNFPTKSPTTSSSTSDSVEIQFEQYPLQDSLRIPSNIREKLLLSQSTTTTTKTIHNHNSSSPTTTTTSPCFLNLGSAHLEIKFHFHDLDSPSSILTDYNTRHLLPLVQIPRLNFSFHVHSIESFIEGTYPCYPLPTQDSSSFPSLPCYHSCYFIEFCSTHIILRNILTPLSSSIPSSNSNSSFDVYSFSSVLKDCKEYTPQETSSSFSSSSISPTNSFDIYASSYSNGLLSIPWNQLNPSSIQALTSTSLILELTAHRLFPTSSSTSKGKNNNSFQLFSSSSSPSTSSNPSMIEKEFSFELLIGPCVSSALLNELISSQKHAILQQKLTNILSSEVISYLESAIPTTIQPPPLIRKDHYQPTSQSTSLLKSSQKTKIKTSTNNMTINQKSIRFSSIVADLQTTESSQKPFRDYSKDNNEGDFSVSDDEETDDHLENNTNDNNYSLNLNIHSFKESISNTNTLIEPFQLELKFLRHVIYFRTQQRSNCQSFFQLLNRFYVKQEQKRPKILQEIQKIQSQINSSSHFPSFLLQPNQSQLSTDNVSILSNPFSSLFYLNQSLSQFIEYELKLHSCIVLILNRFTKPFLGSSLRNIRKSITLSSNKFSDSSSFHFSSSLINSPLSLRNPLLVNTEPTSTNSTEIFTISTSMGLLVPENSSQLNSERTSAIHITPETIAQWIEESNRLLFYESQTLETRLNQFIQKLEQDVCKVLLIDQHQQQQQLESLFSSDDQGTPRLSNSLANNFFPKLQPRASSSASLTTLLSQSNFSHGQNNSSKNKNKNNMMTTQIDQYLTELIHGYYVNLISFLRKMIGGEEGFDSLANPQSKLYLLSLLISQDSLFDEIVTPLLSACQYRFSSIPLLSMSLDLEDLLSRFSILLNQDLCDWMLRIINRCIEINELAWTSSSGTIEPITNRSSILLEGVNKNESIFSFAKRIVPWEMTTMKRNDKELFVSYIPIDNQQQLNLQIETKLLTVEPHMSESNIHQIRLVNLKIASAVSSSYSKLCEEYQKAVKSCLVSLKDVSRLIEYLEKQTSNLLMASSLSSPSSAQVEGEAQNSNEQQHQQFSQFTSPQFLLEKTEEFKQIFLEILNVTTLSSPLSSIPSVPFSQKIDKNNSLFHKLIPKLFINGHQTQLLTSEEREEFLNACKDAILQFLFLICNDLYLLSSEQIIECKENLFQKNLFSLAPSSTLTSFSLVVNKSHSETLYFQSKHQRFQYLKLKKEYDFIFQRAFIDIQNLSNYTKQQIATCIFSDLEKYCMIGFDSIWKESSLTNEKRQNRMDQQEQALLTKISTTTTTTTSSISTSQPMEMKFLSMMSKKFSLIKDVPSPLDVMIATISEFFHGFALHSLNEDDYFQLVKVSLQIMMLRFLLFFRDLLYELPPNLVSTIQNVKKVGPRSSFHQFFAGLNQNNNPPMTNFSNNSNSTFSSNSSNQHPMILSQKTFQPKHILSDSEASELLQNIESMKKCYSELFSIEEHNSHFISLLDQIGMFELITLVSIAISGPEGCEKIRGELDYRVNEVFRTHVRKTCFPEFYLFNLLFSFLFKLPPLGWAMESSSKSLRLLSDYMGLGGLAGTRVSGLSYKLYITDLACLNLKGSRHCFVRARMDNLVLRTSLQMGQRRPFWNETLTFELNGYENKYLTLEVVEHMIRPLKFRQEIVHGSITISLSGLPVVDSYDNLTASSPSSLEIDTTEMKEEEELEVEGEADDYDDFNNESDYSDEIHDGEDGDESEIEDEIENGSSHYSFSSHPSQFKPFRFQKFANSHTSISNGIPRQNEIGRAENIPRRSVQMKERTNRKNSLHPSSSRSKINPICWYKLDHPQQQDQSIIGTEKIGGGGGLFSQLGKSLISSTSFSSFSSSSSSSSFSETTERKIGSDGRNSTIPLFLPHQLIGTGIMKFGQVVFSAVNPYDDLSPQLRARLTLTKE